MLCWILIVGGLLIMMGQHDRSEALFYYFRLEDQVPETHLLGLIEKHISFAIVREKLKASYSDTGRPSIDPELLLRILLIGYLYGITSERKLVEELRMHLAWRWFTGLGFDQEIPHHSTFSKNRHGRFQESKLFEELFAQIVRQCVKVGLVQGKHLSVDGSFVEANAAKESRIPREQLAEAAQVNQTVRQYLVELEQLLNVRNRANAYIGSAKRCGACSQKAQCTSGRYKYLAIHVHESARQRARELANTPEFCQAQRERKKVEALFAELKNHIGLRRLRLRRLKFVREQFFLAATAQNIKRLVRYLSESVTPAPAATT